MDKSFAMSILESVETKTLECDSSLAKEAYRYLYRLKSVQKDKDLMQRIYDAKYNNRNRFAIKH